MDNKNKNNEEKGEKEMKKLIGFLKDEDGGQAIEYGIIAALIGIAIIVGTTFLGESLNNEFSAIGSTVDTVG